jgi:hypothetical protein
MANSSTCLTARTKASTFYNIDIASKLQVLKESEDWPAALLAAGLPSAHPELCCLLWLLV